MVLRACRGILRDDHEAMDAFQATFLVLARKGGSLWVRDSLGPWLHRVACHAAGRAKSKKMRRKEVETKAAERKGSSGDGQSEELATVIHEEVNRLPERYRATIVLCDLEGRTCEEAARHLGCPVGTVGSRLARGRQRLRDRLTRLGLDPRNGMIAGAGLWSMPREPIPAQLASATSSAAIRFLSTRAVLRGTASSLALEILRMMAMTRVWKVATVALVLSASTTGVVTFAGRGGPAVAQARANAKAKAFFLEELAATEVKPGKLRVVVEGRGNLETSKNSDVYCMVEGQTTIISILAEGTRVKKGELVCELDSAALKVALGSQVTTAKGAAVASQSAKIAREIAEIALKEYTEGIYHRERQIIASEIELAKSSQTKAEARLNRTRNARVKLNEMLAAQGRTKTPADLIADLEVEDRLSAAEQELERGRIAMEVGQSKRDVLDKYTKEKTTKELTSEVEKARSNELATEATLTLEQAKEAKFRRQIARCQILAPADGFIVHANDPNRLAPNGRIRPSIEEGATVRERQKLFSIPDLDAPMRVNSKIKELWIDQLANGMKVQVKVDAFPDQTFEGVVDSIAPDPDGMNISRDPIKLYTTQVKLAKSVPGLRPGMSAGVEILVNELDNVLSVPVGAVARMDGKDQVLVKSGEGKVELREVSLGLTDTKRVEIKSGVKAGESVVDNAGSLLTEEQKQKARYPVLHPDALERPRRE